MPRFQLTSTNREYQLTNCRKSSPFLLFCGLSEHNKQWLSATIFLGVPMKELLHCGNCYCFRISRGRNDREKPTSGCISDVVIGQLHMTICDSIGSNNNGKGMFHVVEQAFVGRDRRTDTKNGWAVVIYKRYAGITNLLNPVTLC